MSKPSELSDSIPQKSRTREASKRPKRGRPPRQKSVSYFAEITDWHVKYSFSKDGEVTLRRTPYWEHAALVLSVKFIAPRKLAGMTAHIDLLGARDIDLDMDQPPRREPFHPPCIGVIRNCAGQFSCLGSIPLTALWGLIPALAAGRCQIMHFHGEQIKHGKAAIWSLGFDKEVNQDDMTE